jgi:hypothetical protein
LALLYYPQLLVDHAVALIVLIILPFLDFLFK